MSAVGISLFLLGAWAGLGHALRYDASEASWNLNQRQTATDPLEYWGEWEDHDFAPSPDNWRFPFYVLSLDRYANGDPTNDQANGTMFEHDWMSNQYRFGGDARGLKNDLDYIQGMGVKAIYLMGSPFINQPWMADGYSPLDLTLLDHHHGVINDWRELITEIHDRGMYVLLDNTLSTMGDLLAFSGYLNATAPFSWAEYDYVWKYDRHYLDFTPGNEVNVSCEYPRFWDDSGYLLTSVYANESVGCRVSEFSSYGDSANTGHLNVWENQLSKYGSVQDRLREWRGDVLDKIKHFSCMQIAMLDIDGFRMDKALQNTVDALAEFSRYQRECAKKYGKDNFLIIGEVVGTDAQAAIYFGRGKQPNHYATNFTEATLASNTTEAENYVREFGLTALDGTGFHYTIYGALTRLLGLDGAIGEGGVDMVSLWNQIILQNDLVNANTGEFDPRHLFGATSQDVFRWPALVDGTQRQLLGQFITTLELPGAPQLYWGEEQGFYILDSSADNFVYGRSPMSSNRGWQLHGCYQFSDETYTDYPLGPARDGCHDNRVSLDHRDPSHPVRNVLKRMYEMRQQYPVLNDGYYLETLSTQTTDIYLPGSGDIPSPTGLWSIYRSILEGVQDLDGIGQGNQGVWLLYANENKTTNFTFDCQDETDALVSPFIAGTTVKNLFWPYEELVLENSTVAYDRDGSTGFAGCYPNVSMAMYSFKAFVPVGKYVAPSPSITSVVPSHDQRITASVDLGQQQKVSVEIHFSAAMSCDSVSNSIVLNSTTQDGSTAQLDKSTVSCGSIDNDVPYYAGQPASLWKFTAELDNVGHGIHTIAVNNASTENGTTYTNAVDRFMFRIGASDNPVVFPWTGNYTDNMLHRNESTGDLYISPRAAGAEKLRYSTTWGSSWSSWIDYSSGGNVTLEDLPWSGTEKQKWTGHHVIVEYWSSMAASSDHIQHADLDFSKTRRWPHAFVLGEWNTWGYDDGLNSAMTLEDNGTWTFKLAADWPTNTSINIWGMNPDSEPDRTQQLGDIDSDNVLDWLHPDTLSENVISIASGPDMPHVGWKLIVHDGNYTYYLEPVGSAYHQLSLSILLALVPAITGCVAVITFKGAFYQVKFNQVGIAAKEGILVALANVLLFFPSLFAGYRRRHQDKAMTLAGGQNRRTVLIATMEYEIEDWKIKVKIGGLGVMASLMGKALSHQNLVWVIPCIGGVEYPVDTPAEPMVVTINGNEYFINVQYHFVRSITYVLLDAPIFRQRSKDDPYPPRMDDLDSAIYYSAWNACIAEAIKRFPQVDLYHINDYHGAIAPLYLLPRTIPVSLSLHNAEFQGLWSLKSPKEMKEIAKIFNLSKDVIKNYVQFGEVFNLLHAGASYLRIHQKGFGAVGVSQKYGVRALKRYPIFWGLSNIGALPNPDPSDMDEWDEKLPDPNDVVIDREAEAARGQLRVQAQEWAGLQTDPEANLFVFVGRWSEQKGVDLIADVFPALLDRHRDVQLICVGPVIDLYGKFAALKLQKMMDRYPGRVFSKPQFTALPPFLFSGAEFALIPSRDEPFGLVAVEFGRKGALGVGSKVGGLGQMPGWWYTIESMATKHLIRQFKSAIESALESSKETRALMRARSSLQRFPVAQWIKDLETLQSTSIYLHRSVRRGSMETLPYGPSNSLTATGDSTPALPSSFSSRAPSRAPSRTPSRAPSLMLKTTNSPNSPEQEASISGVSTPKAVHTPKDKNGQSLGAESAPRLHALAQLERRIGYMTPMSPNTGNDDPATQAVNQNDVEQGSSSQSQPESPVMSPMESTPALAQSLDLPMAQANESVLSLETVANGRTDFKLQNVDPFFNDPKGQYYDTFQQRLDSHRGSLSNEKLCVEDYLRRSEKDWFGRYYDRKLGKSGLRSSITNAVQLSVVDAGDHGGDEFQLSEDYVPPRGVKRLLQAKVGDWPVYAFLLAFGQIIAANSYQITLLMGQIGESASRLYIVSSVFLGASILWWFLFRIVKSVYVLSLPFFFYGGAFFILGMTPYTTGLYTTWMQNVATGSYAIGSASGFIFFTMNFLTEGGTPVQTWVFRATAIQGVQQIYLAALWYWGSYVSELTNSGSSLTVLTTTSPIVTYITVPIAALIWVIGLLLVFGLADAYRTSPGSVPAFYISLLRRKIFVWFLIVVAIQNYWLSAPYGRNWTYLWTSAHAPAWAIAILAAVFLIVVWIIVLAIFGLVSREHSWALPLFAIGVGAPRWAQMLWGVSGMAHYLPWVGPSLMTQALLGRALWLWLGVLDTLQGVGFGMLLLQTLTRLHMACAIAAGQVIGSLFTIAARASAPDATGPGTVFPNLAIDLIGGVSNVWFWVCLAFQAAVCVGFFVFFRKEQLFKP